MVAVNDHMPKRRVGEDIEVEFGVSDIVLPVFCTVGDELDKHMRGGEGWE